MRKKIRLLITIIMVLLCAFTLAACSDSGGGNTLSGGNTPDTNNDNNGGGSNNDNGGITALTQLSAPTNLQISGTTLTWNIVNYASGYLVQVDDAAPVDNGHSRAYSLASLGGDTYLLKVKAKGDGTNYSDSEWSEEKIYTKEITIEIPVTEGLAYTPINGGMEYSVSKGTATAIHVRIPAEYNGKPVTTIAVDGFREYSSMISVIIPDSIKSHNSARAYLN